MKYMNARCLVLIVLGLLTGLIVVSPGQLEAQPFTPFGGQVSTDAQRNALNGVRSQANWLQNAIRTAPNYRTDAVGLVWQQFQMFRDTYTALRSTLTPRQLQAGANDLAELEAGLDILQEAFGNHQQDVAAGQPANRALLNMCRVLGRATSVWLQEFNRVCSRLRVGWL
jgi:hypothetical protein